MTIRLADPELDTLDDVLADPWQPGPAGSGSPASMLRERLDRDGLATASGFVTAEAVDALDAELDSLLPYAEVRTDERSVYGRTDPGLDGPGLRSTWRAGHLTRDMFGPHSIAHRLYVSPVVKRFVAEAVGVEQVYEYADPLAGLVCTVVPPGGTYGWHYDTNEFVVTIAIREADRGGDFEYVPGLRRPGDERVDAARRVIDGTDTASVRRAKSAAGDLQLFRGRYALHRVSPVAGVRHRLTLVLSYSDRPGVIGPLERTRRVYGRVTEAHLLASGGGSIDGLAL